MVEKLPEEQTHEVKAPARIVVRTVVAIACGFLAGLAVGPVSMLMAHASDTWMRGWDWPAFNSKFLLLLLVSAIPAGINGAIGAGLAAVWGRQQRRDITWLPAGLHAAAAFLAMNNSPGFFLVYQLVALVFTIVVWPAGRIGQEIGRKLAGSAEHAKA